MGWLDWLGGKEEPWRALMARGKSHVLNEDTDEYVDIHPQKGSDEVEGLLIEFDYRTETGFASHRVLLCWRCWEANDSIYAQGYCQLRDAMRTFRVDRMTALKELRSGRMVDDAFAYFDHFFEAEHAAEALAYEQQQKQWEAQREENERQRKAEREEKARKRQVATMARQDCIDGLRLLAYLALADGARSEAERSVEITFIEQRLRAADYPPEPWLVEQMTDLACGLVATDHAFKVALAKVHAVGAYLAAARLAATSLVGMTETPNARAKAALTKLMAD